jgi:hypothetical protein
MTRTALITGIRLIIALSMLNALPFLGGGHLFHNLPAIQSVEELVHAKIEDLTVPTHDARSRADAASPLSYDPGYAAHSHVVLGLADPPASLSQSESELLYPCQTCRAPEYSSFRLYRPPCSLPVA